MVELVVTDPKDLRLATKELHDWFFDLDDVGLDAERRELVVPFRRCEYGEARVVRRGWLSHTEELPWYRWYLRIGHVVDWAAQDADRLRGGDFHELRYDGDNGIVTLVANVPVTLTVRVDRLRIAVQETREAIGMGRRTAGRRGLWDSYTGRVSPSER